MPLTLYTYIFDVYMIYIWYIHDMYMIYTWYTLYTTVTSLHRPKRNVKFLLGHNFSLSIFKLMHFLHVSRDILNQNTDVTKWWREASLMKIGNRLKSGIKKKPAYAYSIWLHGPSLGRLSGMLYGVYSRNCIISVIRHWTVSTTHMRIWLSNLC